MKKTKLKPSSKQREKPTVKESSNISTPKEIQFDTENFTKKPLEWISCSNIGSQNILLKEEKGRGRYCVAKRDLKEGELIAIDEPYIWVVNCDKKKLVCDLCCAMNPKVRDQLQIV